MPRNLIVSFGGGTPRPKNAQFATITLIDWLDWPAFASLLTAAPPESADKSSRGWFCPAKFSAMHRDSEYLETREALTFDYDVITGEDIKTIKIALKDYEYAIYTTASHTAEKPRVRVVLPLARPVSPDEFCAISRKVAAKAGIELAARESHVAAQMSYLPTVKPGAKFVSKVHAGAWVDPDLILAEYADWTDRKSWPARREHDSTYKSDELPTPAREKPGVIGAFNRAFTITEAIEKFDLPYERAS